MSILDSYRDPLIIKWWIDDLTGEKRTIPRTNESYVIIKNFITLAEIPSEFHKINTITIGSDTLYEAKLGTILDDDHFSVNYTLGIINFTSTHDGQTALIPSWNSRGIIFYPSSRIYTEIDNAGNVKETLADIFDKSKVVYKTPVASYSNIATTYPSPNIGEAVQVEDTGRFYRWDGSAWQYFQILHPTQLAQVLTDIGDVAFLDTTIKTSIVNAINEVVDKIGSLGSLLTTAKDTVVNAINEIYNYIATHITKIASETELGHIKVLDENIDEDGFLKFTSSGSINVKDYGAIGDWNGTTGTDDILAIRAAITAAQSLSNVTLVFPKALGYCISDTITIPLGINVIMEAPVVYTGTANISALIVGSSGEINVNLNATLKLNAYRKNQSDWSNEGCIGIKIINAMTSDITITQARGFTIGVQFIGSGSGFSYNEVKLFALLDNKIGVDCTNETSGVIGWCNENNYYGGRFTCFSSTNLTSSRYGVRITSKDGTYVNNNNNVFYKPSFELTVPTSGEAIPILIERGLCNRFRDIRNEGNSTTTARILNASSKNYINTGFGYASIEDNSDLPSSSIESVEQEFMNDINTLIFNSGAMHQTACYYNGSTMINIPNINHGDVANSNILNASIATSATLDPNFVQIGYGIGVLINTKYNKKFMIRKDVNAAYGGRIGIRCYDSAGAILTSGGAGHPYVKGISVNPVTYSVDYGGCYKTQSDNAYDFYFTVGAAVEKIEVILMAGSTVLQIRSFSIFAKDATCAVWTGYEEIQKGANIGTAIPTIGTWAVGRRIINAIPTVGQPKAWVCTVAGTPGTWVSEGNL